MKIYKSIQEYANDKKIYLSGAVYRYKQGKIEKLERNGKKLGYIDIKEGIKYLVNKM